MTKRKSTAVRATRGTQTIQDNLYEAFDRASANAADPQAQKAFRQQFQAARKHVQKEHS